MHQATGGRTLAQYYGRGVRAQLAEGSSPPLPFASTPIASASLLTMAPFEGQLAALQRATPPFSGRDASALALARLPSFDLKGSPRLNISALADSTLVVSPPHPYHNFPQVSTGGQKRGTTFEMAVAKVLSPAMSAAADEHVLRTGVGNGDSKIPSVKRGNHTPPRGIMPANHG